MTGIIRHTSVAWSGSTIEVDNDFINLKGEVFLIGCDMNCTSYLCRMHEFVIYGMVIICQIDTNMVATSELRIPTFRLCFSG